MHEKKKQRTGQHDPTRTSCPHPTQLCPWATIWPDLSLRSTSPAHALRYCGKLGQEKLKWLSITKVTSDKVKILCASRHLVCTHQLNSSFSYKFLLCYTVSYYIFTIWHCTPQQNQKRNTNLTLFSLIYILNCFDWKSGMPWTYKNEIVLTQNSDKANLLV